MAEKESRQMVSASGLESFEVTSASRLIPEKTALMIVDVTNFDAHPDQGLANFAEGLDLDLDYYWTRLRESALPNMEALLETFRSVGGRVMHVRVGAQFDDFADSQRHFRDLHEATGVLRGTELFNVRSELAPRLGEAEIDKSGASAFTTGNADTVLRNAGVENIVLCGVVTNGCIIASAITAWDLGYQVTVVEDACAAHDQNVHDAAFTVLDSMQMEISSAAEVIQRVAALQLQK